MTLDMTVLQFAGLIGAGFYLASYLLLQLGVLRGQSYSYTLMNMTAAALVGLSLFKDWNVSSAVIQAWFFTVSLIGIGRMLMRDRRLRFTADEVSFAATVFPGLPRRDMRRLLDQGRWESVGSGETLTREGVALSHLFYLAEGSARVARAGVDVAEIRPGDFIGEITYLSGEPATGTVTVTARAQVFSIPVDRLRRFLARNPAIHDQLERSLASDLRKKLNASADQVAAMRRGAPVPA